MVSVDNRRNTKFRSMFWNALAQEWYLGDDQGFLTVWSIYRDSLIKDHQLSDSPITATTNYENPLGSLYAEVRAGGPA